MNSKRGALILQVMIGLLLFPMLSKAQDEPPPAEAIDTDDTGLDTAKTTQNSEDSVSYGIEVNEKDILISDEGEESFFQIEQIEEDSASTREEGPEKDTSFIDQKKRADKDKETGQYSGPPPTKKRSFNKSESLHTGSSGQKKRDKGDKALVPGKEIEKEASINFAENVDKYKSPKKAFFMSLLLPGLGQAYTKNITKSVLFGAAEIGLVAAFFGLNSHADNEEEKAIKFADKHFESDSIISYYNNLWTLINNSASIEMERDDFNAIFSIFDSTQGMNEFIHDGTNEFYSIIKNPSYTQGWDDAEPEFTETGFAITEEFRNRYSDSTSIVHSDTSWLLRKPGETGYKYYGFSDHQDTYKEKKGDAANLHDIAQVFIYVLIANHVASSVDAFISAKVYNRRLLKNRSEQDTGETLWEKIDINHRVAFRENGPEAEMEFIFRF